MGHDLDKLQGTWNISSLEMDEQKMTGGGARVEVHGDRFRSVGMGVTYEGTMVVDEATAPKNFELQFDTGPEKGNTNFGIYELNGDIWKICLATRGSERPTKFAAPPGTGIALETLERQESDAPVAMKVSGEAAGEPAPELAGEWTSVSLVRDGAALPKAMLKHGTRTATANEVTVKFGPQVFVQARYAVDRSQTPMTMDYVLADGSPQHGIWMLNGKQLTTCFGAPGQLRPSEFASTPGDGRTLAVWTPAGT